jgi:hypothetical protein
MADWEEVKPTLTINQKSGSSNKDLGRFTRTKNELAEIFGVTPKQYDKMMKKIQKEIKKK